MKIQKNKTQTSTQSWPWHKVWASTLFYPRTTTGEILLSEGNLSFKQASLWLVFASLSSSLITQIILLAKNSGAINWQNEILHISRNLGLSFLTPVGVFMLCGAVHLIAKLLKSKGNFQSFFIVYAAYFSPLWIFLSISIDLGMEPHKIQGFYFLYLILWSYWMFVITPKVIMSNYGFRWLGSCLINSIVFAVFAFMLFALVVIINPSMIAR